MKVGEALKPGRGPNYTVDRYMDLTRIDNDAGYYPEYTLERGFQEYTDWLRTHEQ